MLSHSNLYIYYQKTFGMVQHHKYSITDLENLIPFERDIYFDMLIDFLEKQEEKKNRK
jgi:hypothetical protein